MADRRLGRRGSGGSGVPGGGRGGENGGGCLGDTTVCSKRVLSAVSEGERKRCVYNSMKTWVERGRFFLYFLLLVERLEDQKRTK